MKTTGKQFIVVQPIQSATRSITTTGIPVGSIDNMQDLKADDVKAMSVPPAGDVNGTAVAVIYMKDGKAFIVNKRVAYLVADINTPE